MSRTCRHSPSGGVALASSLVGLVLMMSRTRVSFARKPDNLVVVSRHGVRLQFPSTTHDFAKYAPGKDFDTSDEGWGVDGSMGVLTTHGYEATQHMGRYQGQKYASDGLELDSCSDMFVYCEEDMPRDEFTAKAFFEGFMEGWAKAGGNEAINQCPAPEPHFEGVEYLIDQGSKPRGKDGQCKLGSEQQVGGVVGKVDEWTRLMKSKLLKLNEVLGCCDRSLCPDDHPQNKPCTLLDIPHQWDEEHWYVTYTGPVYAGKYFSEWFLLNYLNGMDYAWGKLTEEEVIDLAAFVTEYRHFEFDLLAARPFGSVLLMHLVATLEQMETGKDLGAVAHSPDTKLVYYAAHDTNLLYLAELLDLKWVSKGWQPNHTPPGGELIFELYKVDGKSYVKAFFDIALPSQIRLLEELTLSNPPDRVAITIPGCSEGQELLCPLSTLRAIAIRAINPDCVTPPEIMDYVSSLWAKDPVVRQAGSGGGSTGILSVLLAMVAGLALGTMGMSGYRRLKTNGGSDDDLVRSVGGASSNKWSALSGLRNRNAVATGKDDHVELLRSGNS